MKTITRKTYLHEINAILRVHPICALLGPRQCGKTTMARMYAEHFKESISHVHYFDLEDPDNLNAFEQPKLLLEPLSGLIVIDEIQRRPDLFIYLRVLVDKKPDLKLLILGSASQVLIKQSSESLAGRIGYLEMTPFSVLEVPDYAKLQLRGGYPKSYLADSEGDSLKWRKHYIKTFLEYDIPNLGFNLNPVLLRRFWSMLCDYHGNIFNASELGRSLNIDHKSIKRYLDLLTGAFMIRQLQPWFINISKRQVKSYKIFFRDSGIFHSLYGIDSREDLVTSSKLGASWEGFAIEQLIQMHQADPQDCFFWSLQAGAELDLLIVKDGKKYGYEIKYSSLPKITRSMNMCLEQLELDYLTIIVPGDADYMLADNIQVQGLLVQIQKYIPKDR